MTHNDLREMLEAQVCALDETLRRAMTLTLAEDVLVLIEAQEKLLNYMLLLTNECEDECGDECENEYTDEDNTVGDVCRRALEALQWASAAPDFQPEGKARVGWLRVCVPVMEALEIMVECYADPSIEYHEGEGECDDEA